jgi:hypothetical protein
MKFKYNDGGRESAGYKGHTGDCVARAIAIATQTPYQEVYDALHSMSRHWKGWSKTAKNIRENPSPRTGTHVPVAQAYLKSKGWEKVTGNVKLDDTKFKKGTYICSVRRHYTVVKDGVINDTHDCQMTHGFFAEKTTRTVFHHYVKKGCNLI